MRPFSAQFTLLPIFCFSLLFSPAVLANFDKICENQNVYLAEKSNVSFTDNEKQLFCGSNVPGWKLPSEEQQIRQLELSLRARGFYKPNIEPRNNGLYISPGKKTLIQNIKFNNSPPQFADVNYIGVVEKDLNSENIDAVEKWTRARLKAIGYPCPNIEVRASYLESIIYVDIESGPRVVIDKIKRPELDDLVDAALYRFDAIKAGELYNGDYLELTSRRLMSSQVANYSYMSYDCNQPPSASTVTQHAETSEPRYLGFAVGASTEELPLIKLNWLHSRLDEQASSLKAEAYFSPIKQSVLLDYDAYLFDEIPRLFLTTNYEIANIKEDTNETVTQEAGAGGGYIYDFASDRLAFESTPIYTIEDTFEGDAPRHTEYLSLETKLKLTSHYFEYFMTSPRTGYELSFFWKSQNDKFSADVNTDLYQLSGTYLWNYGSFDPPITVFGLRFQHSILHVNNLDQTPQGYRLYLGGDRDIRGFSRKSINNEKKGYQTTSYIGFETRFTNVLAYKLQPFVFYDLAKVGLDDNEWTKTTFLSPGIGLRWQSPIGTFRTTLAHGELQNVALTEQNIEEDWTFFFSFGREF